MKLLRKSRIRALATFFAIWCFLPIILRIIMLQLSRREFETNRQIGIVIGILAGIPQDFFVAFQCYLILVVAQSTLKLNRNWGLVLGLLLFATTQTYYLLDFGTHLNTGLRFHYKMFDFVGEMGPMLDSLIAKGALQILAFFFVVALLLVPVAYYFKKNLSHFVWGRKTNFAIVLTTIFTFLTPKFIPAKINTHSYNVILSDQGALLRTALDSEKLATSVTPLAIHPLNEIFSSKQAQYPLLRETKGFYGKKLFEFKPGSTDRPHVILLFMESFRALNIGALGGAPAASPQFDRLSKEGVLFSHFYSGGVQTTRAATSTIFGVLPSFDQIAVQSRNPTLPLIGMPNLFLKQGYKTAFFHNGSMKFQNKTEFFGSHGYQELHGRRKVEQVVPESKRTSWGVPDEYLMTYFSNWLAEKDRENEPTFSTIFTVTNHHPWIIPDGYQPPNFGIDPNTEYGKYLQTFHYSDFALGQLIAQLKAKGLYHKTVFFILGDHGNPMGEHFENYMEANYLFEENLRIPFLILAPGRITQPIAIHTPGSQVDILPTMMDLFNMSGLHHSVGTSLAREIGARLIFFNNPFGENFLGARIEQYKYIHELQSQEDFLFDLNVDPQERTNIATTYPEKVRWLRSQVVEVNDFVTSLYERSGFAPPLLQFTQSPRWWESSSVDIEHQVQ